MTAPSKALDPENIEIVEPVSGSRHPAHLIYVETVDHVLVYLRRHLG